MSRFWKQERCNLISTLQVLSTSLGPDSMAAAQRQWSMAWWHRQSNRCCRCQEWHSDQRSCLCFERHIDSGSYHCLIQFCLLTVLEWHIFYVTQNNTIKQVSSSNQTNGLWVDGPVTAQNLVANDADQVGMQACWYGSDCEFCLTCLPLPSLIATHRRRQRLCPYPASVRRRRFQLFHYPFQRGWYASLVR